MNILRKVVVSISLVAVCAMAQMAWADMDEATCEFYKNGEKKQKKSGPCTLSQRQGYVNIELRNGASYSLSPGNKANNFKDQNGNKVVRTSKGGGNSHKYKWKHKKIIVKFNKNNNSQSHGEGHH